MGWALRLRRLLWWHLVQALFLRFWQLPALQPLCLLCLRFNVRSLLAASFYLFFRKQGQGQGSSISDVTCRILEISLQGRSWGFTPGGSSSLIPPPWGHDFWTHRRTLATYSSQGRWTCGTTCSFVVSVHLTEPNETLFCPRALLWSSLSFLLFVLDVS